MTNQMRLFQDLSEMSAFAADYTLQRAKSVSARDGIFSMAVSGGTTPKKLFSILASEPYRNSFPWDKTHIFWVDERYVPESSDDSNFKAANDILLSQINISPSHIHKIDTSFPSPAESALKYEQDLKIFFSYKLPEFNMVFLGMGEDGHTASLFPDSPVLGENIRWASQAPAPLNINPKVPRVTLTYPVLNNSETVLFLIGGEKRKALAEMFLENPAVDCCKYPAAAVKCKGSLLWLTSIS